jgi:hypothetical protein
MHITQLLADCFYFASTCRIHILMLDSGFLDLKEKTGLS